MDENMRDQVDQQDVDGVVDEIENDTHADEEDDVYSTEIEDEEGDPYELTDEEIAELADEEDEEPAEDDADDAAENSGESENESGEEDGTSNDEDAEDGGDGEGHAEENPEQGTEEASKEGEAKDYAAMAASDVAELNRLFPSLGITDLRKIDNAGRYGALRDMGLSVEEAFRATNHARISAQSTPVVRKADGKAHIRGDMPAHQATDGFSMSAAEMRDARELFPGKSDKEIIALYRSVSRR
jgi:hypothetical protein